MRNYKKENEWKKKKYIEIRAYIDKEIGEKLKISLQKKGKSIASWIRDNANEYLKKQ